MDRNELGDVIHILNDIFLRYSYYPTLIDLFTLYELLEGRDFHEIGSKYSWS